MCGAMEEIWDEVRKEFRKEFRQEVQDLDLHYIRIIMEKQNLGAEEAMDYLRIPPEKQERYLSFLSST